MFQTILVVVFLLIMIWWLFLQLRHLLRRSASTRWPTVLATIQRGAVGAVSTARGARAYGSFFGYGYVVQGVRYAGLFVLIGSEEHARSLQEKLPDLRFEIRYAPSQPEISYLSNPYDQRFEGLTASQNPDWIDQAPPFQMAVGIQK